MAAQTVMDMGMDMVVYLAGLVSWIDMNHNQVEVV